MLSEASMVRAMDIVGYPEEHTKSPVIYLKSLNYLLGARGKVRNMFRDHEFIHIGQRAAEVLPIVYAREVVDVIYRTIPRAEAVLSALRKRERSAEHIPLSQKPPKKTVYADGQNVHNSSINRSVIHAVTHIWKTRVEPLPDLEEIECKLLETFPEQTELILKSMEYIRVNTSYFGEEKVTLEQAFKGIYQRVQGYCEKNPEHMQELHKRLLEELYEMEGQCTTGHLARLVNIVQGFETDPEVAIKISLEDQCNSVVRFHLQKELETADEKVIEGMLSGSKEFLDFIRGVVRKKLSDWHKTYGDEALSHIRKSINGFCGTVVFQ